MELSSVDPEATVAETAPPSESDAAESDTDNISKHWSERECRGSAVLAPHFDKGFTDCVLAMLVDVQTGVYGREDVPGPMGDPKLNIPSREYAYAKGFQAAHNSLSAALMDGFISYEKQQTGKPNKGAKDRFQE